MAKTTVLSLSEQIRTEADAYEYLEGLRWPDGPECPHCGNSERCYYLTPKTGTRTTSTGARTERRLWKCAACRGQFSVLTGTVMHGTKIPVRTWIFVLLEMVASKNGVAAREIERKYGLTNRTAWHLTHRIREAMKAGGITTRMRGTIVADETLIGGANKNRHAWKRANPPAKTTVLTLINKDTGEARSKVIANIRARNLKWAVLDELWPSSILHTDSLASYGTFAPKMLAGHETVDHHIGQYTRLDGKVSTNQAEGYFSQLKRSIDGTHHQISAAHLPRYLAEFDFRFTTRKMTDTERLAVLVARVGGKRLTYRPVADVSQGLVAA
jgi:hypothetical protein